MLPYLLLESIHRLSLYVADCSEFKPSLISYIVVLVSYSGLFTYVFMLIISVYDRSAFHVTVWSGVFLTELAVSGAEMWMPKHFNYGTVCNPHELDVPDRDMAIVSYVVMFYMLYDIAYGSNAILVSSVRFMWMITLVLGTGFADLFLRLHNIREILTGAIVGALTGAMLSMIAVTILVPNYNTRAMDGVKGLFMLHGTKFRS